MYSSVVRSTNNERALNYVFGFTDLDVFFRVSAINGEYGKDSKVRNIQNVLKSID